MERWLSVLWPELFSPADGGPDWVVRPGSGEYWAGYSWLLVGLGMLGRMYPWGVGCLPAVGPFCDPGPGPGSGGLLSAFTVSVFASG